eukprot:gene23554-biopygen2844
MLFLRVLAMFPLQLQLECCACSLEKEVACFAVLLYSTKSQKETGRLAQTSVSFFLVRLTVLLIRRCANGNAVVVVGSGVAVIGADVAVTGAAVAPPILFSNHVTQYRAASMSASHVVSHPRGRGARKQWNAEGWAGGPCAHPPTRGSSSNNTTTNTTNQPPPAPAPASTGAAATAATATTASTTTATTTATTTTTTPTTTTTT